MGVVYSIEERVEMYKVILAAITNHSIIIDNLITERDQMIAEGVVWDDISTIIQAKLTETHHGIGDLSSELENLTWDYCELITIRPSVSAEQWAVDEDTKTIELQRATAATPDYGFDNLYVDTDSLLIENSYVEGVDGHMSIAAVGVGKFTFDDTFGTAIAAEYLNKTLTIRKRTEA